MLGRLRMSIDQCIDAYNGLASKIFSAGLLNKIKNGADTGARFSAEVLEQAIKDVIKKYSGSEDTPMRDPVDGCKVYVVTLVVHSFVNRSLLGLSSLAVLTTLATVSQPTCVRIPMAMSRNLGPITRFGKLAGQHLQPPRISRA
jgi:hypothetical protein